MMTREELMRRCLELAKEAASEGEVPVGALVARGGEIIAEGKNSREGDKNALAHAETAAICRACRTLGGWRLPGCELYVTLEPCPMCAGAILNARIEHVVFGAYDAKNGAFGSVTDLSSLPGCFHTEVEGGLLAEECSAVLSDFFTRLRRPLT